MAGRMIMFDKLMFSNRLGRINSQEVDYWKMMFNKILKVGEEFEVVVPQDRSVDAMFSKFYSEFSPTQSLSNVGEYGIYDVKPDGSVPNGMELITVGRRFNWKVFYDMNKRIMDKFQENEFYTTHHTGMHIHLLAGYSERGDRELERDVPELILANYYQLHRIFAPELYFIASGGVTRHALTRYILFRRPPFDYTPMTKSMNEIQNGMNEKYGKYQMFNLNPVRFNNRNVSRFHVEIRHPDTHLSPAYATALVALEVAMLNKAIELSQCGIISMKQEEYDTRKNLFDKFANLGTGDRDSDSTELTDGDIDSLGIMASEMIRWFKSEIVGISQSAYEILTKISVKPASLMRIEGNSWRMIEQSLYSPEVIDNENIDKITEMIILQQITDCFSAHNWKTKVSSRLSLPITKVNELINQLGRDKIISFDREIGAMMFKQII